MIASALRKFLQFPFAVFARGIQSINVNRVSFEENDGAEYVRKKRVRYDWLLIFAGNIVFRFRRSPLRVLYKREWIQWERLIKRTIRDEVITEGSELVCEKIPGCSLLRYLSDVPDDNECLDALRIAIHALRDFHSTTVEFSDSNQPIRLSHGDASIANVLIEPAANRVEWFDFDLQHDLRTDCTIRHADDLRSLLFTSAGQFDVRIHEQLVEVFHAEYGCEKVWLALKNQVSNRWFGFDLFHRSQIQRSQSGGPTRLNVDSVTCQNLIETILKTG